MILLLLLNCTLFKHPGSECDLTVIVMNDHRNRPIATDENFFWQNTKFLDTLCINSTRLYQFVEERRKTLTEYPGGYQFTVSAAILVKTGQVKDTLYTDSFFRSWKINGKNYDDNVGDFRKMFGNLFLFHYAKQ